MKKSIFAALVAAVMVVVMSSCQGTGDVKLYKDAPEIIELTDAPKVDVSNGGITSREFMESEGNFYDVIYTSQELYVEKCLVNEDYAEVRKYRVTYRPMIEKNKLVLFPEMEIMERYYTADISGITSKILVSRKSFDLPAI